MTLGCTFPSAIFGLTGIFCFVALDYKQSRTSRELLSISIEMMEVVGFHRNHFWAKRKKLGCGARLITEQNKAVRR